MLAAVGLAALLVQPPAAGLPPVPGRLAPATDGPPEISAPAWVVADETLGLELAALSADERRSMASTTKLMTGLLVVADAAGTDEVAITPEAAAIGKSIGLVAGEIWTVDDLLAAMMIHSANDAAAALAIHVGGSQNAFVEMMNQKAAELGLADTRYLNPHGLDISGHYSSARDLLALGKVVLGSEWLAGLAASPERAFSPAPGSDEPRLALTTNELLGSYPGVTGLKTGSTRNAGSVLVASAKRGRRSLIVVVMGAENAAADSANLLEWAHRRVGLGERMLVPLAADAAELAAAGGSLPPDAGSRLRALAALEGNL